MEPFITLGISLGLGLLIGLQRERAEARYGGIRTFPLISLFGAFCGMLGQVHGPWPIAAGVLAIFGTLAIANRMIASGEEREHGQTTEVAALLTFAIGAYLPSGDHAVAAVATGLVVILLHLKEPMHVFVRKMGPKDMGAIMQLVVISLIILPLLPNRAFGPLGVLNPFDIWRMVVLIVSLSLSGYIIYKMVGRTAGAILGGILGGLISSTATTVSYARRARESRAAHALAVVVILIATAVSYGRVIIEVLFIARSNLDALLPPLLVAWVWSSVVAGAACLFLRGEGEEMPPPANPAEMKSALVFGVLYALITLAVAAVKQHFDSSALYLVAIISGLTDMDAITLSVARMVENARLEPDDAWRLILAASLSNLSFKGFAATALGGWRFGLRLAPFFAVALLGGVALIWFWPKAPGPSSAGLPTRTSQGSGRPSLGWIGPAPASSGAWDRWSHSETAFTALQRMNAAEPREGQGQPLEHCSDTTSTARMPMSGPPSESLSPVVFAAAFRHDLDREVIEV